MTCILLMCAAFVLGFFCAAAFAAARDTHDQP
jgi:hypothetical protein